MAGRAFFSKLSSSSVAPARSFATRTLSGHLQSTPLRLRPLLCAAAGGPGLFLSAGCRGTRCFSTRPTTSSLNDPSPNWSNRPPKETILLDGCDFEHWLVVMEPPDPSLTRDEIIDSYIKTLSQVLGSEEEARMNIYSVSTKHYFAFGAKVSEEISYKIKGLPKVRWVLPDSYLDVKNKDYGGEPFIDGKAVPYDPKYHEEWVRNNARAQERSRRNDRPRNFDRSRNFERRRENMQNFQNRDAPQTPPVPSVQNSTPPSGNPSNVGPPNPGVMPNYNDSAPNQQNNYVPNAGSNFQGPSYQGGGPPSGQGYQGGPASGQGYQRGPPSSQGYQGGPPSGQGYQGGPASSQGYQGGPPSGQGYQGGPPSGQGYQGGPPSGQGYQGGPPSAQGYQGGPPSAQGYQGGPPSAQEYQGGGPPSGPGYQGGMGRPTFQGGNPGYQGYNPSFQGGSPGFQGCNPSYQPGNPSSPAQPAVPNYQPSNPAPQVQQSYQPAATANNQTGGSGYQGGSPSYQQSGSSDQGQGKDIPGRD